MLLFSSGKTPKKALNFRWKLHGTFSELRGFWEWEIVTIPKVVLPSADDHIIESVLVDKQELNFMFNFEWGYP